MAKDEMKYACGCGKHYLSYPAYIAHRKGKHNNETVAGTVLPQTFKTKRGRPSFNYLHKELQGYKNNAMDHYEGMSIIELGLLRMEDIHHNLVIAQANEDRYPNRLKRFYQATEPYSGDQHGSNIISTIHCFTKMLTTHMQQTASEASILFLTQLTIWLARHNQQGKEYFTLDWYEHSDRVQVNLNTIVDYFKVKEQADEIDKLAKYSYLSKEYFFELTIILSEWLHCIGRSTGYLKRRKQF